MGTVTGKRMRREAALADVHAALLRRDVHHSSQVANSQHDDDPEEVELEDEEARQARIQRIHRELGSFNAVPTAFVAPPRRERRTASTVESSMAKNRSASSSISQAGPVARTSEPPPVPPPAQDPPPRPSPASRSGKRKSSRAAEEDADSELVRNCTSGLSACYCRTGRTRSIVRIHAATGIILERYCSVKDAARKVQVNSRDVGMVCKLIMHDIEGHVFRFEDEHAVACAARDGWRRQQIVEHTQTSWSRKSLYVEPPPCAPKSSSIDQAPTDDQATKARSKKKRVDHDVKLPTRVRPARSANAAQSGSAALKRPRRNARPPEGSGESTRALRSGSIDSASGATIAQSPRSTLLPSPRLSSGRVLRQARCFVDRERKYW